MSNNIIRKFTLTLGMACLIAATTHAQFSYRNLAVLRVGDNGPGQTNSSNPSDLAGAHQSPVFIDEYNPSAPIIISSNNTGTNGPVFSVAIPTNDPVSVPPYAAMWINGHAGTEGYLSLSDDGGTLTFSGYGGNILASNGTPSGLNINRGICIIDVSGNSQIALEDNVDWYELGTNGQVNPRGVVSDNGTNNFFGTGAGGNYGTEWYQLGNFSTPETIQNFNSTRSVAIINGNFYTSLDANDGGILYPAGIYNYAPANQFGGLGTPVALPEGDAYFLNLVIPASPFYPNVESFDINPQKTIAYIADNTFGIQKYVENAGNWTLACAFGITNNTSSNLNLGFPAAYTGCFGLVVDWTGNYPVIFATTTEGVGGFANSNRLIRLDDNYNFTDGQLHTNVTVTTLATAWSANVAFRGLAWTPDRRPQITSNPANQSVVTSSTVNFTVIATANFANTFEWLVNGAPDLSQTTATYSVPSAPLGDNNNTYQVIVSNLYGAVTSTVANLTVTSGSVAPSLISPVPALKLTNAVNQTITIPVIASGTTPLSYQWWQSGNTNSLTDSGDFLGTGTSTLTINVSSAADAGSYSVVVSGTGTPSSNLVAKVNIVTPLPIIFLEPAANTIVASNGQVILSARAYPLNSTYQWYQGSTPLFDGGGHWSGSQGPTLTDLNAQGSDSTNYYVVATDAGGSVTSSVVTLTVAPPTVYSFLPYTSLGQIYTQNFDTLPDPGTSSVNNGTTVRPVAIGGTNYYVSNPFDFAAPIGNSSVYGGLNLPALAGWYSSDLGAEQIQATSGDNTTGLIVSFGCLLANNSVNPAYPTNNRAMGMLSSPATSASGNAGSASDGVFALQIKNLTGKTLTNFNLSYVSELWRDTANVNMMTNYYYVDQLGTNTTPTNNWTGGLTNLTFTTNQPGFSGSNNKIYGTNQPIAITNMAFVNVPLATPWTPGAILWIVWEEPTALSGAQGIGIDNLVFSSGPPSLAITPTNVLGVASATLSWPVMFTSASLISTPNLGAHPSWSIVGQSPTAYQGMNSLTVPASPSPKYFALGH